MRDRGTGISPKLTFHASRFTLHASRLTQPNPKSETMVKFKKSKWAKQTPCPVCPFPLVQVLNLFRISIFGFRISLHVSRLTVPVRGAEPPVPGGAAPNTRGPLPARPAPPHPGRGAWRRDRRPAR